MREWHNLSLAEIETNKPLPGSVGDNFRKRHHTGHQNVQLIVVEIEQWQ